MDKKGAIWISAVLYFGLGIVVLSLILAAGMPVINKLKDKNIAIQTKEVMFTLDNNIREVAKGGPGTQRLVRVDIKKGNFMINEGENWVHWENTGKAMLSEPGLETPIEEGVLRIKTSPVAGKYKVELWVPYDNEDGSKLLQLNSTGVSTLQGGTDLIIKNNGARTLDDGSSVIEVLIREK